jgi:hypothetical protein
MLTPNLLYILKKINLSFHCAVMRVEGLQRAKVHVADSWIISEDEGKFVKG